MDIVPLLSTKEFCFLDTSVEELLSPQEQSYIEYMSTPSTSRISTNIDTSISK